MKTKLVNRYYCDFCRKSGGHAGHMRRHESRCTNNPDRECGVCRLREDVVQPKMADLLAKAREIPPFNPDDTPESRELRKLAMQALRHVANDCPACILAALRQAKVEIYDSNLFDFKAELKAMMKSVLDERHAVEAEWRSGMLA